MLRSLGLSAAFVLVGATNTNACSTKQPPPTTQKLFARARTVFVAHMVRTEEAQMVWHGETEPIVEGTFRTIEVPEGVPPQDQKVRSPVYGPGNCTMPLISGWDYVFFLVPIVDSFTDTDHNFVWWPDGSFGILNLEVTEVKRKRESFTSCSAK
jgi:hypothetical protein